MNARFVGDLLYHTLFDEYVRKQSWQSLIFLILVVILNFLEIINNWASIRKYFNQFYNSVLFLIDVVTIAIFFWQIHILSEIQSSLKEILIPSSYVLERKIIPTVIFSYLAIYMLYVIWNFVILGEMDKKSNISNDTEEADPRQIIQESTLIRLMQISFMFTSLALKYIVPKFHSIPVNIPYLIIIFIIWIFTTIYHNNTLNIFDRVIK